MRTRSRSKTEKIDRPSGGGASRDERFAKRRRNDEKKGADEVSKSSYRLLILASS